MVVTVLRENGTVGRSEYYHAEGLEEAREILAAKTKGLIPMSAHEYRLEVPIEGEHSYRIRIV